MRYALLTAALLFSVCNATKSCSRTGAVSEGDRVELTEDIHVELVNGFTTPPTWTQLLLVDRFGDKTATRTVVAHKRGEQGVVQDLNNIVDGTSYVLVKFDVGSTDMIDVAKLANVKRPSRAPGKLGSAILKFEKNSGSFLRTPMKRVFKKSRKQTQPANLQLKRVTGMPPLEVPCDTSTMKRIPAHMPQSPGVRPPWQGKAVKARTTEASQPKTTQTVVEDFAEWLRSEQ